MYFLFILNELIKIIKEVQFVTPLFHLKGNLIIIICVNEI